MAYAAVVTIIRDGAYIAVTIAETDAAAASEATIDLGVRLATLVAQRCELDSGTGTTVDPKLAKAAAGTGNDLIAETDTAAAIIDNNGQDVAFVCGGSLYHKSVVDAGTDNVVNTEYLFKVGY